MVTICQSPNLLRYLLIIQSIHTYVCIRNISYNSFFGWEKWWISSYVFMNKRCPLYYLLCYHIAHRSWYFGNGAIWGNQTSLPQIPAMEFKCGKPTSTTNFPKSILHLKCNVKLKQLYPHLEKSNALTFAVSLYFPFSGHCEAVDSNIHIQELESE